MTLKRFPATMLDCTAGAIAFLIELETQSIARQGYTRIGYDPGRAEISDYLIFGLTALLGIPLFFAIELWLERRGDRLAIASDTTRRKRPSMRMFLYLGAAFLLGVFYAGYEPVESDAIQLFLLVLAAHLAVSFIAYLRRNESNGFWEINKMLLLRILTSLFYSGVLMLGLSLALLAIDKLFQVEIDPETYAQLACILAVFNTWFFLAGVPSSLAGQEERTDYPKGLKIFTQFVLLPLVTIYLAILYPYAVKLLIESDLPRGWVSNPVLWFAVVGILAFLLLYPIRDEPGNGWIRTFSRYYFIALMPLLALPALGIYTRVRDYGITEPRYFVIALVLWLFGLSLYFILSKRKDIRLIPVSLFFVALFSAIGPLSAFSIAKQDQFAQLEHLLEKNKLIGPARDIKDTIIVSAEDYDRIRSITNYFRYEREKGTLEEWLRPRMPKGIVLGPLTHERDITSVLNFNAGQRDAAHTYIQFGHTTPDARSITGYDYYVPLHLGPRKPDRSPDGRSSAVNDTLIAAHDLTVIHVGGDALLLSHRGESVTVTYSSIFSELVARRDSVLRSGADERSSGLAERIDPVVHRAAETMDIMITFRDASVQPSELSARDRSSANERSSTDDRSSAPQPKVIEHPAYWGEGALFVKLR